MLVPGAKERSYATDHVKRLLQLSDFKQNRNELPNFIKNSKYDQENHSGGQLRTDLTRQVFAIRFADVYLNCNFLTDCSLGMISTVNSDCLYHHF